MIPSVLDDVKIESLIRQDSLPQLCSAADRLRRLAQAAPDSLGASGLKLLDDLLAAAAEAEQSMALQRARIRYLESLSVTDELTGLLNRRGFETELSRALARARRAQETGLLLMCDLNHFKAINDTYGHPAGDAILRAVGQTLKRNTRESDYVARVGGDEFAVIMTNTPRAQSEQLARKLSTLVNGLSVRVQGREIPVSAGFGMTSYDSASQPETLLFFADQNLYKNKAPQLLEPVPAPDDAGTAD
jgi:diguanylate cyclase (GGDEF)-like protein